MNGARADPSVKIIKAPNNTKKMMMGVSHHFFLTLKNFQNSTKIDNLECAMLHSLYLKLFVVVRFPLVLVDPQTLFAHRKLNI